MSAILNLISSLLGQSPEEFSSVAFELARHVSGTMANFAFALLAFFFITDLAGSTINFRIKQKEEIVRLALMLILGGVFIRASFWLSMYIFSNFQQLVGMVTDGAGMVDLDFSTFTANVRSMIDERDWGGAEWYHIYGYVLGSTENMILFIFLIFFFLSIFGLLLSMLLVPIMIFIELYTLSAFAPLPMSSLFSSQKAIAIGFLKAYVSVCIRGALVFFGIYLSSAIMNNIIFDLADITLQGILLLVIPIVQLTLHIMVVQRGIKGAEQLSKTITGATN
jgi:hypothetical protein